jgi:hypothetical protein
LHLDSGALQAGIGQTPLAECRKSETLSRKSPEEKSETFYRISFPVAEVGLTAFQDGAVQRLGL